MPVQEWVKHQADIVRWKADQQTRLFKVQGQIHDFENQIRVQKAALADRAILLFNQSQLAEPELVDICKSIDELKASITQRQAEHETINREQPPQAPDRTFDATVPKSGLKCPVDGKLLAGHYCPEHGLEGVPVDSPAAAVPEATIASASEPQLICPVCKQVLNNQFCPEHGVKGVSGQ